jgi:transcriptional regulator NrdR family protein
MTNEQPECSKKSPSDRGLTCRYCGSHWFRVVYTRARMGGTVVRRRECGKCKQRVTTWERAIGNG